MTDFSFRAHSLTKTSMQRACPIPDPQPHSDSDHDDLSDKGPVSRFFIKCWRGLVKFFRKHKPNPNQSPQSIMEAAKRLYGITLYDLVGAIVGGSGPGKSSLTNRLCNSPDVSPHAAPIGVVECTTEPSVYFNADCPRFKIMDNPGINTPDQGTDFDRYAEKHVIEIADFYLAVMSDRVFDFFPAFQAWCQKRAKPFAVVRTMTHKSVKTLIKLHRVDQVTAFKMLKQATYDDLQRNGIQGVKLFLVDNELWEDAILAYNEGDHSNAVTPYDEGKLMKFVAKASLARYSLAGSASEFLGELFRRTSTDGESGREDDDDAPQGDDIETMTRTTHDAAQAHATQSIDLPSSQSTGCQTDALNRRSRGPTEFPSVC